MEQQVSTTRRFTPISDGLRGHMIGWDNRPQQGESVMVGALPYRVTEVSPQGKAGIWTASLEVV